MTQQNIVKENFLKVNAVGFGCFLIILFVFVFVRVFVRVCFPYRIRCADILADINTGGQWTVAKAVFSGSVTGTIRLVRTKRSQCLLHKCYIICYM